MEPIEGLETIDPRPLEMWRSPVLDKIDVEGDREAAIQKATDLLKTSETVTYTDASAKHSILGAAEVILDRKNNTRRTWQGGFGSEKDWSVHTAELIAFN